MLLVAEHPRNLGLQYGYYIIDDCPEDELDFCHVCSNPSYARDDIGLLAYEMYNPEASVPNAAPMLLGYSDLFYGDTIFAPTGKAPEDEEYILRSLCQRLCIPYKRLPRYTLRDVRIAHNMIPGES